MTGSTKKDDKGNEISSHKYLVESWGLDKWNLGAWRLEKAINDSGQQIFNLAGEKFATTSAKLFPDFGFKDYVGLEKSSEREANPYESTEGFEKCSGSDGQGNSGLCELYRKHALEMLTEPPFKQACGSFFFWKKK